MGTWLAVVAKPNASFTTAKWLDRLALDYFIVKRRVTTVVRGRKVDRVLNAFVDYVFVRAPLEMWENVRRLLSVIGFVHVGENVATLSNSEIERMRKLCDADGVLIEYEDGRVFKPGDAVRIKDGVFYGHEGTFHSYQEPGCACIQVPILGREVPMYIGVDEIELIVRAVKRKRRRERGVSGMQRAESRGLRA